MQAINITAYTEDASQIEAVKAFMKALKIKFEIANVKSYELSTEQQETLDSQINLDKSLYTDAESIYTDLKKKYEL
jgi:phosphoribosylamine-glycine ligase